MIILDSKKYYNLGSVSMTSDINGTVSQYIEYIPFGEEMYSAHHNTYNSPYRYTAKELDEETGLYYYGARYYNPKLSVWLSVDPMVEKYISLSPYNYVMNNQIKYIDPDGREKIIVIGNQGKSPNSDRKDRENNTGYAYKEGTRHFLQAGLEKAREYKQTGGEEMITMIIYKGQYSSKEINLYKKAAKKDGINVKVISDNSDIADYINKKKTWSWFGSKSAREKDLITDYTYVGHGNSKSMLVGYHTFWSEKLEADDFNKSAFDKNANIYLNSCGSALGSMYEKFLEYTSGQVTGFNVTVEWGRSGDNSGYGIGKYHGYKLEYTTPENRDKKRKFVHESERMKIQNGTRE